MQIKWRYDDYHLSPKKIASVITDHIAFFLIIRGTSRMDFHIQTYMHNYMHTFLYIHLNLCVYKELLLSQVKMISPQGPLSRVWIQLLFMWGGPCANIIFTRGNIIPLYICIFENMKMYLETHSEMCLLALWKMENEYAS